MAGLIFSLNARDLEELSRRVRRAGSGARHIIALQMAKDTEKYVPALTKSLSNRTIVNNDTIIYPGPYARYRYYGKLMVDPTTGSPFASAGATKVLTDRDLVFNKTVHSQAQAFWFEASKAQNLKKWKRVAERAFTREIHG